MKHHPRDRVSNMYLRNVVHNIQSKLIDKSHFVWFTTTGCDTGEKLISCTERTDDGGAYAIFYTEGWTHGRPLREWSFPLSSPHRLWRHKIELVDKNSVLLGTIECTGVDFFQIALGR